MISRSQHRLWVGVDGVLRLTLAIILSIGAVSGPVIATPWATAAPTARAVATYSYGAASNTSEPTFAIAAVGAPHRTHVSGSAAPSTSEFSALPAVSVAAETAPRTIAIGEDMEGRVIPYANKIGADYYSPPEAPPSQWMENNRNWINDRMDEGCRIVDCGAAPGRANYPEPTSPYYQMERGEIGKRDYPYYSRVNIDGP